MSEEKAITKCHALLIDIGGKQRYIFGSNKLKENIGASYIMANKIFGKPLEDTIAEMFCENDSDKANIAMTYWEKTEAAGLFEGLAEFEVGYVGGGNSLLLFREGSQNKIREFVQKYSKKILLGYPGVRLIFGSIPDFDIHDWEGSSDRLNKIMNRNKSLNFARYTVYKPGIATDCPLSGEGQEVYDNLIKLWISKQTKLKLVHNRNANRSFKKLHQKLLQSTFTITDEIEELNMAEEKSYVAVVHVDGNGLGKKFREAGTLTNLRALSVQVSKQLKEAENQLIQHLIELSDEKKYPEFKAFFPEQPLRENEEEEDTGRKILPLRFIINAGDDITFVCHGQLGIYLAEKYIEFLLEATEGGISIPSCAGVAIVKKKYPFFRAYTLAEELAGEAKKISRLSDDDQSEGRYSCWMNYHISAGGYTGDFEQLQATISDHLPDNYPRGPFFLAGVRKEEKMPFKHLKDKLSAMLYEGDRPSRWPLNKLVEVKSVLTMESNHLELLRKQIEARKLSPDLTDIYTFPYYDMIELLYFYPEPLLKKDINYA